MLRKSFEKKRNRSRRAGGLNFMWLEGNNCFAVTTAATRVFYTCELNISCKYLLFKHLINQQSSGSFTCCSLNRRGRGYLPTHPKVNPLNYIGHQIFE